MLEGKTRRGRRARARRGAAVATTLGGIPGFVDRDLRRRRRLARRDRRAGARGSATRASRCSRTSATAASARRSSPATSARSRSGIDVTCVMAADNQMDPADLDDARRARSRAASSTTRRRTGSSPARRGTLIPRTRYLGNAVLSLLTKIASGYWHVADSQSGYTAIAQRHARAARPRPRLHGLRLPERHARPPERRGTRACATSRRGRSTASASARASATARSCRGSRGCCCKGFFWRLREKYVIRDFHPLVFFYALRLPRDARRASCSASSRSASALAGQPGERRHRRPRRAAAHLRLAVHAVRDVVRHGVEQGPALARAGRRRRRPRRCDHRIP